MGSSQSTPQQQPKQQNPNTKTYAQWQQHSNHASPLQAQQQRQQQPQVAIQFDGETNLVFGAIDSGKTHLVSLLSLYPHLARDNPHHRLAEEIVILQNVFVNEVFAYLCDSRKQLEVIDDYYYNLPEFKTLLAKVSAWSSNRNPPTPNFREDPYFLITHKSMAYMPFRTNGRYTMKEMNLVYYIWRHPAAQQACNDEYTNPNSTLIRIGAPLSVMSSLGYWLEFFMKKELTTFVNGRMILPDHFESPFELLLTADPWHPNPDVTHLIHQQIFSIGCHDNTKHHKLHMSQYHPIELENKQKFEQIAYKYPLQVPPFPLGCKRVFWVVNLCHFAVSPPSQSTRQSDPGCVIPIAEQITFAQKVFQNMPQGDNTHFVFIFTHYDRFKGIVRSGVNIEDHFDNFVGDSGDCDNVKAWIMQQFVSLPRSPQTSEYHCFDLNDYNSVMNALIPIFPQKQIINGGDDCNIAVDDRIPVKTIIMGIIMTRLTMVMQLNKIPVMMIIS